MLQYVFHILHWHTEIPDACPPDDEHWSTGFAQPRVLCVFLSCLAVK